MKQADDVIGYRLYSDGRGLKACVNVEQRRGWIRAQHEATVERHHINRHGAAPTEDIEPDWWREEMAS